MAKRKKVKLEVAVHVNDGMARTPKEAMAPKEDEDEKHLDQKGHWDLDTLMSAEEIKQDEKRMEKVMKAHAKKLASIDSISKLKDIYDAKYGAGKKDGK